MPVHSNQETGLDDLFARLLVQDLPLEHAIKGETCARRKDIRRSRYVLKNSIRNTVARMVMTVSPVNTTRLPQADQVSKADG